VGRKAKYHRSECIEKAMHLFWSRGFSGTSTRDLGECLDLKPGSLYATFGSKEGLYSEVLRHYAEVSSATLDECFREASDFQQGLSAFFDRVLASQSTSSSCLLAKTLANGEPELQKLRKEAHELMKRFEDRLTQILRPFYPDHSQARLERVARFIQVQVMGLRNYSGVSPSSDTTAALIKDVQASIDRLLRD